MPMIITILLCLESNKKMHDCNKLIIRISVNQENKIKLSLLKIVLNFILLNF